VSKIFEACQGIVGFGFLSFGYPIGKLRKSASKILRLPCDIDDGGVITFTQLNCIFLALKFSFQIYMAFYPVELFTTVNNEAGIAYVSSSAISRFKNLIELIGPAC
jgi:hypothetical protein